MSRERLATAKQMMELRRLYGLAAARQGWGTSRQARLDVCGETLGRPLGSFKEVERFKEVTKLMSELRLAASGDTDLEAAAEACDPERNERRLRLNVITQELLPALAKVPGMDAVAYVDEFVKDRFGWRSAEDMERAERVDLDQCIMTLRKRLGNFNKGL